MGLHASILDDNVIPLIKQTANDLDLPLIDVYTPLVNYPEAFKDGVHPNSQGAKIMATQIFDAIT
jgi:acyl-CoA thioesterase-1